MSKTKLRYRLINDYLFRAVLQENQTALKYLISSLLSIPVADILTIDILNPIELGDAIDEKTCILDLHIQLNGNRHLNIEMQATNNGDWPERSLYYLSRTFTNLHKGDPYTAVAPCTHIGILTFSPFPESPEFYSEYLLQNKKTHKIYSDKFAIHVLDLTQIDKPAAQEEYPELYYWAKLFLADTLEEIDMLSKHSEGIHEAVVTLKKLSADEKIQLQCEAREMYDHDMASAVACGRRETYLEIARNMLQKGYPLSEIISITDLTEAQINDLKKS